jgi:LacI family transcriptional regulator
VRRVTLRDVAAASGVHVSTVSRILRGDTSRVRPNTVDSVRGHAAALGYRADPWAASLRSGRTNIIAMIVPRITDVVLANAFEAFEAEAASNGYLSVVASSWDDTTKRAEVVDRFVDQRIDGVVIADARIADRYLEELVGRGLPVLQMSRRSGSFSYVAGDDFSGAAQAGKHIGELGAENVVVLGGPEYASTSTLRVDGFIQGYESVSGGRLEARSAGFDLESGYRAMVEVLNRGTPDAIFVVNDFAAIGALSEITRRGLVPGRDIAVVGYNDIPVSAHLATPLSSVRSDLGEMGRTAFSVMRDMIDGNPVSNVLIDTRLIIRESSAGWSRP